MEYREELINLGKRFNINLIEYEGEWQDLLKMTCLLSYSKYNNDPIPERNPARLNEWFNKRKKYIDDMIYIFESELIKCIPIQVLIDKYFPCNI